MMNNDNIQYYQELYQHYKPSLPGSHIPWFNALRDEAMQHFVVHGLPTRYHEDWKYTSLATLEKQQFAWVSNCDAAFEINADTTYFSLKVQEGNVYGLEQVQQALPKHAIVTDLHTAAICHPQLLKGYLGKGVNFTQPGFAALNTAFMHNGIFIYLPKHAQLARPLRIDYHSHSNSMSTLRNVIIADDAAQLTVIESFDGCDDSCYFNNVITEIFIGNQAILHHYKLQSEGLNSFHVGNVNVTLQRDSHFDSHSFSFGGSLVRSDTQVNFENTAASCELNGLYVAKAKQHMDHHTCIHHHKPYNRSTEYYKGILNDYSNAVFNGKVIVAKDAQHSDASQYNKNLLLSRHAQINTRPQLEIFANDVKCAHGATVGQLDEEALFYLRSRGISVTQAQQLLIHAFADEIIAKIRLAPIKRQVIQSLLTYLGI